MDEEVIDGTAVLALLEVPAGADVDIEGMLAAKGDGVDFADHALLYQLAHT